MGFLDSIGNFFGDITGINQHNRSAETDELAKQMANAGLQNQATASSQLGGIGGKSASDFANEATRIGQGTAEQMGRQAASLGSQQALQAARTAGLNKGQAAQQAGQQAGQLFTQGQMQGQGLGMQAYGQGAETQLGGASGLGNVGASLLGASAAQKQAGLGQSAQGNQATGGLLSAIGGLFSDEKVKEDIKESPKVEEVADKVKPVAFEYKDEMKQGDGEHVGVTAQDMEKTPLKENVIDTPMGKMIHPGKQENSNLNMIVQLSKKVDEILKQKGMHYVRS